MKRLSALVVILGCLATGVARGYDFIGLRPLKWDTDTIAMDLQLNTTRPWEPLRDGKSSWNSVAQSALALWNTHLSQVRFTTFTDNTRGDGNQKNEVFFSPTVYGHAFGSDVLAVTTAWRIGSQRVEADTIFNTAIDWDSYRGDLDGNVIDLRRVAIHEFGHTLGLDHPDQAGQVYVAIMNSTISDLDTLAADDVRGVCGLYPSTSRYVLDLQTLPAGSGEILANPAPGTDGKYPVGQTVTLTARPRRGYRFNYWATTADSTRRTIKVQVVENETIRADFTTLASPRIVTQPRGKSASYAGTVQFRAGALNAAGATCQWQFNHLDIHDATNATLMVYFVTHAESGLYSCRVTTPRGSTQSRSARLVVDGY